jgi:hypothetical protein
MNLELVVAPGSESYIGITNNTISGTETDFNITGLAATGTNTDGSIKDAQIIVREKAPAGASHGMPLAKLHVVVLPPQTVHFAIFYCSDDVTNSKTHQPENPSTTLPANLPTQQQISDELNATFNPQTNVQFICDGTFRMNNLENVFLPSGNDIDSGALPCGSSPSLPALSSIESQSNIVAPNEPQTIWRIFVVNKISDEYVAAFTQPTPNTNKFTFIRADSTLRVYSHEGGRALQVSWDGDYTNFDGRRYGPFDMGPWPLEFQTDGLNIEGQQGLMSDNGDETQTRWIRNEYWNSSNENANQPPFK